MNEPIHRVHRQDESNSTIGTIATHIGMNVAFAGVGEGVSVLGAKKINPTKHPIASEMFKNMAYSEGIGTNKFVKAFTAGAATKPGRIINYGSSLIGGLITGSLASRE